VSVQNIGRNVFETVEKERDPHRRQPEIATLKRDRLASDVRLKKLKFANVKRLSVCQLTKV
jgi:hypothetical protein